MKKHIFLIGMPGSGKSTLGKKLSNKLNCPFIDIDQEIEKQHGKTIAELFNLEGEDFFRKLESEKLTEITTVKLQPSVVSLGGGTPCYHNNIDLITKTGLVIYLKTDAITLSKRIQQGSDSRPMFKGLTGEERTKKILELMTVRESFYSRAHLMHDVIHDDVDRLLNKIIEFQKEE